MLRQREEAFMADPASLLRLSALSGQLQQPFSCVTSGARAHMNPSDPADI